MSLRRLVIAGLLSVFASAASCGAENAGANANSLTIVSATGEHRFAVEIADDDEERRIGLMHRKSMPENAGMLFDFGPDVAVRSMWMKNTLIPLDMAFIDAKGRIVRIAADATPRSLASISSGAPVLAVLEVNGGRFKALGVREGDYVRHPLFGSP
ncbi:MAG: DUF192 domain-containing protein [Parvularculaceae bacterium]|nr:DUF192 domain-containing protein [Parvularculaceae bacterium]